MQDPLNDAPIFLYYVILTKKEGRYYSRRDQRRSAIELAQGDLPLLEFGNLGVICLLAAVTTEFFNCHFIFSINDIFSTDIIPVFTNSTLKAY